MGKINAFQILTILSVIAMICWKISDHYGGMIFYLIVCWIIVIPALVLYLFSFVRTIIKLSKTGVKANKLIFGAHVFFAIFLLTSTLLESEIFKSRIIFSGTMIDDLFSYTLVFREDGTCENNINGFLGFKEIYKGRYRMTGDTIIFSEIPSNDNFISDRLLLNKEQGAIFLNKDKNGNFSTEKVWLNYFELEER